MSSGSQRARAVDQFLVEVVRISVRITQGNDFFSAPVFAPSDLPQTVWDGTFPACGTYALEAQRAAKRRVVVAVKRLSLTNWS